MKNVFVIFATIFKIEANATLFPLDRKPQIPYDSIYLFLPTDEA